MVISAPLQGLTQTVTQTRKKAGGYRRTQWIAHRAESAQKGRKALDINAFRRSSHLHTQEVTGSSPAVSTKKVQESQRIMFIGTQCDLWGRPDGTGYEKISRGNFPRLIFSLIPSLSERQHFIGYADLIHDSRRICYPAKAGTKVVQPVPPRSAASFSSERVNK